MKTYAKNASCPCSSQRKFSHCCEPYIVGIANAPSAETLMRSRYTAYVLCDADYLSNTHHISTRSIHLKLSLEDNFKHCHWTQLKVTSCSGGGAADNEGTVCFEASFIQHGNPYVLKEVSRFVKENGCWLYVDGDSEIDALRAKSLGRNDPCWCGNGKKFKRCHGD